jgi:hypothetical protein
MCSGSIPPGIADESAGAIAAASSAARRMNSDRSVAVGDGKLGVEPIVVIVHEDVVGPDKGP